MKKVIQLVIARHGSYTDFHLNDDGKKQMQELGEALKQIFVGKVIILASTTPRAFESAQVVAQILNAQIIQDDLLSDDTGWNWAGILELVMNYSNEYNHIVLITHMSHAEIFPKYFCEKVLGMLIEQEEPGVGKGWIIDCVDRTREKIP